MAVAGLLFFGASIRLVDMAMERFSDRIGVTQPPSLARDGMSPELRMALWNHVHAYLFEDTRDGDDRWVRALRTFYLFHHMPLNRMTYHWPHAREDLYNWWFDGARNWWDIYNTIECLAPWLGALYDANDRIYIQFNNILKEEGSRFRFVGKEITEITDEHEIAAVNEALAVRNQFAGAREHIASALRFLGQRPEPDYRNSIRESISAVESALKVLTGMNHAPLGEALKGFSRAHPIHGALLSGLNSLYGYTSNEHGIRHALIEADANVGFAEAKFMVVACAAFVNFLIAKGVD